MDSLLWIWCSQSISQKQKIALPIVKKYINYAVLCLVDRLGIAQKILLSNAAKMIMVHNHPSGDPTPSKEDLNVSNELKKLGELLGIPFVDSIILGDWVYKSFAEEGIL